MISLAITITLYSAAIYLLVKSADKVLYIHQSYRWFKMEQQRTIGFKGDNDGE